MLLDKAQQIKAKLRYFEGKTVDSRTIWKIMLCPRNHAPASLIEQCRQDFGYDDIFSALHYREDIDIYVVYKDGDTYSSESHEAFAGKSPT